MIHYPNPVRQRIHLFHKVSSQDYGAILLIEPDQLPELEPIKWIQT